MAIQTIRGPLYYPVPPTAHAGAPSFSTSQFLIDAASEEADLVFLAPKTGNIRKIVWATRTVTTGATLDIRMETVLSGARSGSLVVTNANGAQIVADANDNVVFTTQLTADCPVTKGTAYAAVILNPAASFGNMQIAGFLDEERHYPRSRLNGTNVAQCLCVAFEYDDGTYAAVDGIWPVSTLVTTTFGSGTNPNHRALRFQVPFKCRVSGALVWCDPNNDWTLKLFDSDAAVVLASTAVTAINTSQNAGLMYVPFATSQSLLINTNYRIAVVPDGAGTVPLYEFTVETAAELDAFSGGQNCHLSTCNGAPANEAAWTQTLTQRPFIFLVIDGLDDGVSAGGARNVIIGG